MADIWLHPAHQDMEGIGVIVKRLFPVGGLRHHDPFVLWDDFEVPPAAGFPDHPHRGFEAITYVMQGSMQHSDDLGHHATVQAGGLQRFTAGRGIVHSEMPSSVEPTRGIQLWINLPQRLKQIAPDYQQVDHGDVPVIERSGAVIRELVGGASPLRLQTPVRYLDVQLQAQHRFEESMSPAFRGLVYVLSGIVQVKTEAQPLAVQTGEAALFETGFSPCVQALADSHFIACFGQPHNDPIHQHGTFVD